MRAARHAPTFCLLALLAAGTAFGEDTFPLLENPAFEAGLDGWSVSTGAGGGDVPSVVRVEDGVLRLTGTAATTDWKMVTQEAPVRPGQRILLTVRARSQGLRRDEEQHRNANGFLLFKDAGGKAGEAPRRIHFTGTAQLDGDRDWVTLVAHDVAPERTATLTVGLFSSQTGDVWFDDVDLRIEDLAAASAEARTAAFDALRLHLERTYPFWGLPGKPDPAKLFDRHREAIVAAADEDAFLAAVKGLLAELDDPHVWFRNRGRIEAAREMERPAPTWSLRAIAKRLTVTTMKRRQLLAGTIGKGEGSLGYCRIGSFQLHEAEIRALDNALASLAGTRALILDVRANGGGDESIAYYIARRWVEETDPPTDFRLPYASVRVRDATLPGFEAFHEPQEHVLVPRKRRRADRRRVCVLQGPACMSSTEAFLLMAQALDGWTTVGRTSRGASANPQPFSLLPGVQIMLSTWRKYDLDGNCVEGVGVAPDVEVTGAPTDAKDPTLERAIELLGGS